MSSKIGLNLWNLHNCWVKYFTDYILKNFWQHSNVFTGPSIGDNYVVWILKWVPLRGASMFQNFYDVIKGFGRHISPKILHTAAKSSQNVRNRLKWWKMLKITFFSILESSWDLEFVLKVHRSFLCFLPHAHGTTFIFVIFRLYTTQFYFRLVGGVQGI